MWHCLFLNTVNSHCVILELCVVLLLFYTCMRFCRLTFLTRSFTLRYDPKFTIKKEKKSYSKVVLFSLVNARNQLKRETTDNEQMRRE